MVALLGTTTYKSYLLLHNKLPPQLNGLKEQILITFQDFWGSGIWKQLSWLVLALGLSWGFTQAVSWDYSLLKACLGLEDPFQGGTVVAVGRKPQFISTWLPEDTGFSQNSRPTTEKEQGGSCFASYHQDSEITHTLSFLLHSILQKRVTKSSSHSCRRELGSTSWRESCQRTSRHVKTTTSIHVLLIALYSNGDSGVFTFPV